MKCWPLDMRHLIRNNLELFGGIGNESDPQYTLTSALAGGGCGLAVALENDVKTYGIRTILRNGSYGWMEEKAYCLKDSDAGHTPAVAIGGGMDEPQYVVRRITPVEAERLQGFPGNYTNVEFRGKPAPDTARYKALGNSMTVPVMAWIARRILMVEKGEL